MKKVLMCLVMMIACFSMVGGIFAVSKSESNFIDIRSYNELYKMSEDSDVNLPFLKMFAKRATYDKIIGNSGISFAADAIDITGELKGMQTILSGDTVNLTGKIEYANIIANNVIIDGEISKDVLIMAQSIFVTDKAKIGGDLICMAGTIELKGTVSGNVILSASDSKVSSKIGKDFRASSNELEVLANSDIKGNIYIETNSALNILDKYPNAVVKKFVDNEKVFMEKQNLRDLAIKGLIAVLSYVVLYYIIKKLNKNVMSKYSLKTKSYPTFTILMGFAGLFLIPIEMVVILIGCAFGLGAVLGPILILYIALFIAVLCLALFITGVIIFECIAPKILKNRDQIKNVKWLEALLLLAIFATLFILKSIPVISGYANAFIILVALGSVVTNIFRKEKVVVEIKEN